MQTRVVKEPGSVVAVVRTPCACGAWNSFDVDERLPGILCGSCERSIELTISGALLEANPVDRCARCDKADDADFWVRKDFDPKIGVGIVVVAAILAFWTYGASLLVAAIVDAVLYWRLPFVTTCYHCRTEHRGVPANPRHGPFDLAHQEDIEQAQAEAVRKGRGEPEPDDGPVL